MMRTTFDYRKKLNGLEMLRTGRVRTEAAKPKISNRTPRVDSSAISPRHMEPPNGAPGGIRSVDAVQSIPARGRDATPGKWQLRRARPQGPRASERLD